MIIVYVVTNILRLGVVELTTALHYVFDAPEDKIIWDVAHQAYPHKILTGVDLRYIYIYNI